MSRAAPKENAGFRDDAIEVDEANARNKVEHFHLPVCTFFLIQSGPVDEALPTAVARRRSLFRFCMSLAVGAVVWSNIYMIVKI